MQSPENIDFRVYDDFIDRHTHFSTKQVVEIQSKYYTAWNYIHYEYILSYNIVLWAQTK